MSTRSSGGTGRPLNLLFTNKRRVGTNWKNTVRDPQTVVGKGVNITNIRPILNQDPNLTDNNANAFRARPIKHYRRQYVDSSNKNRAVASKNLMYNVTTPGGLTVTDNTCNDCRSFSIPVDERSFNIDKTRSDLNLQNKCARITEDNARRRARGAQTNINSNQNKPKYYTTNKSYLQSRCKLFEQKEFNFASNESTTIKPGSAQASDFTYRSNCCYTKCGTWTDVNRSCGTDSECTDFIDTCCNVVMYNPSNPKYGVQGAVSSSNRILRLKVDSITLAASNQPNREDPTGKNFYQVGNSIANAVAYSSRTETPFTAKSKYQDVNKCINPLYRPSRVNTYSWRNRNAPMKLRCPN